MKKSKCIAAYLLAIGMTLTSLPYEQGSLCAAASSTTSKKGTETKRFTVSKKAGTYTSSIKVTLKAKKGYKVYYTTNGAFTTGKVISSGRQKKFTIRKTTTLTVYAVKKSVKLSAKTLKNTSKLKKSNYFRQYQYIIQALKSTASPDTAASTGTPEASSKTPEPSVSPDGSMTPPDGSMSPDATGAPEKPDGTPPAGGGNPPGGSGSSGGVDSYSAVTEYTADAAVEGETFASTGTDENAILISNNATVSIINSIISRASSDSTGGDNSSFYGVGAAVLATEGTAWVSNSKITTDAAGAAGLFAYAAGTVYAANTTITTAADTSGGIHAAGGGTLYAWDMTVETNGQSSAAIRSDRGGGKMVVEGGSYTSNGIGSPAVYSTADIAVAKADLTANGSEAVCIEGLNSLRLFDSNLTGNMSDDSQNDCTWNVILYQSMSGDSQIGNSTFEMNGGTLTAKNGGMFYTTNTESTITLSNVDITYAKENDFFLRCTGNNNQRGWGTSGQNGADCLFTAIRQEMSGDIIWDSISQLDFYITDGSTLQGAVRDDESCAGSGGNGYCNLYITEDSVWTVTANSTVTSLYCAGSIQDEDGKTVTIQNSDGTVYVQGDSSYTVTVEAYQTTVDTSAASSASSWSDYQVTNVFQ